MDKKAIIDLDNIDEKTLKKICSAVGICYNRKKKKEIIKVLKVKSNILNKLSMAKEYVSIGKIRKQKHGCI